MHKTKSKAIHFSGLRLSLALVLGLLLVPAYVVAPVLFSELASMQAGLIAGKVFHISNLAILILLVSAVLFSYRIQVKKSTWYLLGLVILMVAINTFGVTNMMGMIKAEAGDVSALDHDDPLRWAFAFWHGIGSILQLITSLVVVVLVMRNHCSHMKEAEV
ncbi:MAG: DUF4149 domain-containing protein [Ghiorsea sp.]|nr:DUF4149 domain-containing protein [Ghiorsea sp.]